MTAPAGPARPARPREPLPPDVAAVVLALAGIRRGDRVLDLTPHAGLTAAAAAAAGDSGRVTALARPGSDVPGAHHVVGELASVPALDPEAGRVSKVLLVEPDRPARALAAALPTLLPLLAPGARVTVACGPNPSGRVEDGLPAVLAGAGLHVVHAEGAVLPSGARLAVAVGRPGAA